MTVMESSPVNETTDETSGLSSSLLSSSTLDGTSSTSIDSSYCELFDSCGSASELPFKRLKMEELEQQKRSYEAEKRARQIQQENRLHDSISQILEATRAKLQKAQSELEEKEELIASLQRNANLQTELTQANIRNASLEEELNKMQRKLDEREAEHLQEVAQYSDRINETVAKLHEQMQENAQLKSQLVQLQSESAELREKADKRLIPFEKIVEIQQTHQSVQQRFIEQLLAQQQVQLQIIERLEAEKSLAPVSVPSFCSKCTALEEVNSNLQKELESLNSQLVQRNSSKLEHEIASSSFNLNNQGSFKLSLKIAVEKIVGTQ